MVKKYKIRNKLERFKVLKGEIPKLINPDLAYDEKITRALDSLDMVLNDEIVYQGLKSSEKKINWQDLLTGALIGGLACLIVGYFLGTSGVI